MSVDAGDHGGTARVVGTLTARRFRGGDWLPVDQVADVARSADERIGLLHGELERLRRENEALVRQVEMLRHGALPSAAPQGPDSMVIELAVRAQEEANRTIEDAGAESAEIIADARRQAEEIVAEAHRRAGALLGTRPDAAEARAEELRLLGRVRELEARQAALAAAAQQQVGRWQAYLAGQAEQVRAQAEQTAEADRQLRQVLGG
ncbi:DivIVA domain-containing protein [Micromonospora haikouensis]|uniref:DivIVA domain-containing protein n=1 Tax=Micromonospora haikouensis TaxID=686309 RepID=UPI00379056B1